MASDIGLWIDHKKAVIVRLDDEGEEIQQVESGVGRHIRYRGGSRQKTPYGPQHTQGEDHLDNRFTQHLNKFYEQVIARIRGADEVLILGPGEAKSEFEKRLTQSGVRVRIAAIETAGKMTVRQIAAKVRDFFRKRK